MGYGAEASFAGLDFIFVGVEGIDESREYIYLDVHGELHLENWSECFMCF